LVKSASELVHQVLIKHSIGVLEGFYEEWEKQQAEIADLRAQLTALQQASEGRERDAERMKRVLRICREELYGLGCDAASAWEHGSRMGVRGADDRRDEIYAEIDAALSIAAPGGERK
jgi:hypothetical protein